MVTNLSVLLSTGQGLRGQRSRDVALGKGEGNPSVVP